MSHLSRHWTELYREAVLEPENRRMLIRIDDACDAIRCRSRELWYAGSTETEERHALDSALRFLGLLRTIGADEWKHRPE
jgi:hypothetical protein